MRMETMSRRRGRRTTLTSDACVNYPFHVPNISNGQIFNPTPVCFIFCFHANNSLSNFAAIAGKLYKLGQLWDQFNIIRRSYTKNQTYKQIIS